jgi:hypothetical protein
VKNCRFGAVLIGLTLMFCTLFSPTYGQDEVEITVGDVYPPEMSIKAFTLKSDSKVKIDGALGLYYYFYYEQEIVFYGWIVNANTRKTVWHMMTQKHEFEKGLNQYNQTISLPKGDYEIYYTAQDNYTGRMTERPGFFGRLYYFLFGTRRKDALLEGLDIDPLKLTISGSRQDVKEIDADELLERVAKKAVISINRTLNNSRVKRFFRLSAETPFRVYFIGEGDRRNTYDYAWIQDFRNFKTLFFINPRRTKKAGGGRKNVIVDTTITFPAGDYVVNYNSDDSHSYEAWNTLPPDDPRFWGITLWPVSPEGFKNAVLLTDDKLPEPLLAITEVRNNKRLVRTIKVEKPMDIKVLCIGEGDPGRKIMYDHGWIMKTGAKENLWEMNGRGTNYAGGAVKNRLLCEILHLGKGTYTVGYITDDSHAFANWNSPPPYNPERWGITLWITDERDRKFIEIMK